MKILQVCPRYYPYIGGVENRVRNISERLIEKYNVSVFTTDPSGELLKEEVINGVKIRRFKSWETYYFSKELKKHLMKNSDDYDVVHAHSYHAFPALYAAQAKNRNKFIFTPHYHGRGHTFFRNLLHTPYRVFGRKIFEKADKIICVSNYEKNLILDHFKVDDEKVVVIPNGVNLEEFKGLEKRRKDCRAILCVSRLEKYKGVHFLIKAMPKLDADIALKIVGKGPYKKSLVKLVRSLGLRDRVKFYQDLSRKELLQRYADANLFALLSKYEAYGISVAEALASKTPCIVTKISALKEWVDHKNCFGVDYPIEVEELACMISKVIGKGVGTVQLPSWDEAVERLTNVYEEVLGYALGEA